MTTAVPECHIIFTHHEVSISTMGKTGPCNGHLHDPPICSSATIATNVSIVVGVCYHQVAVVLSPDRCPDQYRYILDIIKSTW